MTPQLRHELGRIKQAIDQEIKNMRGREDRGAAGGPSWMKRRAAPQNLPDAVGWSVPVEIETKDRDGFGSVTVYLSFAPDSFPDAEEIIEGLQAEGVKVKVWRQKKSYDDRGGQSNYNRDRQYGDRGGSNYRRD
jgi:hypothetical protein